MSEFYLKPNSRNFGTYRQHENKNFAVAFTRSFFPYFTKKWNSLNRVTRNLSLYDFKSKIKSDLVPEKIRQYAYGSKISNKLLTRLRVGVSYLNSNSYTFGRVASPSCLCHNPDETTKHYLLNCFLYSVERQSLLSNVIQLVPNFPFLSQSKQLEMLIFAVPGPLNPQRNLCISFNSSSFA